MKNIKFKYHPFKDNLFNKIFNNISVENTIFVFPSEKSKREAIKKFQQNWVFSKTFFYTFDELKKQLFISSHPILQNENRTLAFYASLTDEDREFFKISNYFQSIDFAYQFFKLWEEFNDELVDESIDYEKLLIYNVEFLDWQKETFERLKNIKKVYRNYITNKGFNDIIFLYKPENFNLQIFDHYEQFVLVNQFYYTALDKELIQRIASADKTVIIHYQLPEALVNTKNLEVKDFSFKDLLNYQQRKNEKEFKTKLIDIIECNNDFSMMISLLRNINKNKIDHIVDILSFDIFYSGLLSPEKFKLDFITNFSESSIYKFFHALHIIIDSIVWEPGRKQFLIPLQAIQQVILCDDFFSYFLTTSDRVEQQKIKDSTLNYLFNLIENDFKYLDAQGYFYEYNQQVAKNECIQKIIDFSLSFIELRNIQDLILKIDTEVNGVIIQRIISDYEFRYSNILEVFYAILSDFQSIELIGLVDDWTDYFEKINDSKSGIGIAAGILKLFLIHMAKNDKKLQFTYKEFDSRRIDITNLLDSRNIDYAKPAIINVIEGKIPTARQTPFLFTEKQRKFLNLKTYEDIKLREKYYFFRLILSSFHVFIFTQKNIEQNIEISSFLEEIMLEFNPENLRYNKTSDQYYNEIYRLLLDTTDYNPGEKEIIDDSFFKIPVNIGNDFPYGKICLTAYDVKALQENPFAFYIQQFCNIYDRKIDVDTDFSPRLIGNIVHEIINEAWQYLTTENAGPLFGYDFALIDEQFVKQAITKILDTRYTFYYRVPHNYTQIYFEDVLLPVIIQGVIAFFKVLDRLDLSDKPLEVIPEKEFGYLDEQKHKTLFRMNQEYSNIEVKLRGRADLRLYNPNDDKYIIFDYKTGKGQKEQLIVYELYYYLLENPHLAEQVESYIYEVFIGRATELHQFVSGRETQAKSDLINKFTNDLKVLIQEIIVSGFGLPIRRSFMNKIGEISRSDLHLSKRQKFNRS